jgi:CheY-like chemotaxis protein
VAPPSIAVSPMAGDIPRFADDRGKAPFATRCILVVEDEPNFARILYDLAHELGYSAWWPTVPTKATTWPRVQSRCDPAGHAPARPFRADRAATPEGARRNPAHPGACDFGRRPGRGGDAHGRDRLCGQAHHREELKDVFARLEAKLTQKVKRVLLVEDDDLQRESIARLIGDDDIEITAVGLAQDALDLLRRTIYDCMIIDLKLPDMLGNELLKRMSTEDIRSFPPVIVYTGRNLTRDEEAELRKYSRSIIIKGARSPERLLDEVTLFLHKVESQLSHERQTHAQDRPQPRQGVRRAQGAAGGRRRAQHLRPHQRPGAQGRSRGHRP